MRTFILLAILAMPAVGVAGEGLRLGGHSQKSCEKCYPEVKTEPIKRHCYEVEYDQICVPGVTFYMKKLFHRCSGKGGAKGACPCDFCPNPGKTKCVKRFKKVEYECGERIVCDWNVAGKGKGKSVSPVVADDTVHTGDYVLPPVPAGAE